MAENTVVKEFEANLVPQDDISLRKRGLPAELASDLARMDMDDVLAVGGIIMVEGEEGYEVTVRMAAAPVDAGLMLALALKMFLSQVGDLQSTLVLPGLEDYIEEMQDVIDEIEAADDDA